MINFIYQKQRKYFLFNNIFYNFYSVGGVFLTSHKSKIRVDNTLDKRLELLRQSATPEIRKLLFGQEQENKQ